MTTSLSLFDDHPSAKSQERFHSRHPPQPRRPTASRKEHRQSDNGATTAIDSWFFLASRTGTRSPPNLRHTAPRARFPFGSRASTPPVLAPNPRSTSQVACHKEVCCVFSSLCRRARASPFSEGHLCPGQAKYDLGRNGRAPWAIDSMTEGLSPCSQAPLHGGFADAQMRSRLTDRAEALDGGSYGFDLMVARGSLQRFARGLVAPVLYQEIARQRLKPDLVLACNDGQGAQRRCAALERCPANHSAEDDPSPLRRSGARSRNAH